MNRPYRVIVVGTGALIAAVLALAAFRPALLHTANTMAVEDFGAYWTATKVALAGGNAYDEAQLLAPQQVIEPHRTQSVAAWSPPWTFAAFLPFTPLEFAPARWVWRFVQMGTILTAVTVLWRMYGGPPNRLIWAWAAAFLWYPTLQTLGLGQHSNLVLIGVVGWLGCQVAGRDFLGGAVLALILVKPQNVYLVGFLIAVWSLDTRSSRMILGAIVGLLGFTTLTLALNPAVFGQYFDALTNRPPSNTVPPTLGMLLRRSFSSDQFWLVFVPPIVGLCWALWHYSRNRSRWNWPQQLPLVVLVSCLTSPYGWMYDQILFLVPIIALLAPAAPQTGRLLQGVMLVAALSGLCLALHAAGWREVTFVWHAPVCLGLYLLLARTSTSGAEDGQCSASVQ